MKFVDCWTDWLWKLPYLSSGKLKNKRKTKYTGTSTVYYKGNKDKIISTSLDNINENVTVWKQTYQDYKYIYLPYYGKPELVLP